MNGSGSTDLQEVVRTGVPVPMVFVHRYLPAFEYQGWVRSINVPVLHYAWLSYSRHLRLELLLALFSIGAFELMVQ